MMVTPAQGLMCMWTGKGWGKR